ncbi:MAG: hypothetical protein KatS3mg110_1765 [Pirellulaceae bacterium]|nr:MAG: hypothetical protein KatS3mg110_1765 [Pirellulaceae bacterium]
MRRVLDSIDRRIEVLVSRDLEEWVWGEQLYKVVEVNLRRAGRLADAVRQQLVRLLPEKPVKKWRSYTPYVPPRHLRRKYGVAEDVLRELKFRKLPPGEISVVAQVGLNVWNCEITVEEVPTSSLESQRAQRELHGFTYCRLPGKPQPPQQARFYLELEFSQGVRGPIALGYGCHFGLGLFESQESADEIASS